MDLFFTVLLKHQLSYIDRKIYKPAREKITNQYGDGAYIRVIMGDERVMHNIPPLPLLPPLLTGVIFV